MPIKSKVFIQTLQKSQDRHKISFAFEFNDKNAKKVFWANLPPPNTIRVKGTVILKTLGLCSAPGAAGELSERCSQPNKGDDIARENLNNREVQSDNTIVDEYYFTNIKGDRCYPKIQL